MKTTKLQTAELPMKRLILALSVALAVSACTNDLTVPNLNAPSVGGAVKQSTVVAGAQGMLSIMRGLATQGVRMMGSFGRVSYDLSPQEPRDYTYYLVGPRSPVAFGAGDFFTPNFSAIVNARTVLGEVGQVNSLSAAEQSAIRGWVETVEGYAYAQMAIVRAKYGAPVGPPDNPTGKLAPVGKQAELADSAIALYDAGMKDLQQGGSTLPFSFTSGFSPFATPAGLVLVNRALKVRLLKYLGRWSDVLATLPQTFIDPTQPMTYGAYFNYSTADGVTNPFYKNPHDYMNERIRADAQKKPDGTLDNRVLSKIQAIAPYTLLVTVSDIPVMYNSSEAPFPLIKNEELILTRAEAELATGDAAGALADDNIVRQKSGGLAPLTTMPSQAALLNDILYNRTYSLMWEGGFPYLDARQYGKLGDLPDATTSDGTEVVFDAFNWPQAECTTRAMSTGPCGTINGQ